jgi:hypothetical protein
MSFEIDGGRGSPYDEGCILVQTNPVNTYPKTILGNLKQ